MQRASTCAICGMVSQEYGLKVEHEKRCLQRYLSQAGFRPANADGELCAILLRSLLDASIYTMVDAMSDIEPYQRSSVGDLSELSDSYKLDTDVLDGELREENGVTRDLGVLLNRTDDDVNSQYKRVLYTAPATDGEKLNALHEQFLKIIERLVSDEELLQEIVEGEPADGVMLKFLHQLGEEPAAFANNATELAVFRQNLEKFLRTAVKPSTFERSANNAESIDEILHNLITFPYDLK